MKTKKPLHQGVYLKSKRPEARNNTVLAAKLNLCRTTLWKFMKGKRRLDPDLAARLGEISGEGARVWLERQHAFDVHQAESRRNVRTFR
jgi:plasmid maintenance system antidote protein VapI